MMANPNNKSVLPEEVYRNKKLKSVLTKLLNEDFILSDDTLLEKLFSVLSDEFEKNGDEKKAADLSLLVPWLCLVLKKWKILKKCVKIFAFRIAGVAAKLKPGFKTLFEAGFVKAFCSIVKDEQYDQSILLGYSDFLYSLLEQDTGCKCILEFGLWRDMVHIALNSKSIYTARRGRRCTALLIVSLSRSHSPNFTFPILDSCFRPLTYKTFTVTFSSDNSPPESPSIPLFPDFPPTSSDVMASVAQATEIVAQLLENNVPSKKINFILSNYKIGEWAWKVIEEESENIELINALSRLLAYYNCTTLVRLQSGEVEYSCMRALTLLALHHCQLLAQKHLFSLILDCCIDYQTLWAKHGGKILYSEEDLQQETYDIENNLIITQCMPLYICMKVTRVMESDVMDMFADKVFSLSCKETQRVCYVYRDCLREAPDRSIEALCLQGIRSFLRIPTCCSKREQVVMSFQCMMHTLKEFVPDEISDISADCIVARKHPGENLVSRYPSILSAILDGLVKFIPEFHITWKDSLETVCILTFIQGLIRNPSIPTMLCAKALQLARLVITEFIPPNLALLVNTLEGSSMEELGKLLYKKTNDIHWEVRDSALEVVAAVAEIAQARFPAFQSLILENDLPSVAVTLMATDPNAYVRASAVSCLSGMVKIPLIWDTALYSKKLIDQLICCLIEDTEGIVRHRAALLVNDIYTSQVIPGPQMEKLLDVMFSVSIRDLHWETRIGCLDFWISVISKTKAKEGMLDGEFPAVIFSTVKKKIVTLDPPEIRSRLFQILQYLASSGCLFVLWSLLNDDCDLEVAKKSRNIIEELILCLGKYDFFNYMEQLNLGESINMSNVKIENIGGSLSCTENTSVSSENKAEKNQGLAGVDDVIEEIVCLEDLELLSRMAQVDVKCHGTNEYVSSLVPPRRILQTAEFLKLVQSIDLSSIVNDKTKWVSDTCHGLHSILDDILSYNTSVDHKLTDCY